jgi:hypothetical protein
MYGEALDIFYEINDAYIVCERNNWGLGDMSKKMVLSLSKVVIEIRYVASHLKTKRQHSMAIGNR